LKKGEKQRCATDKSTPGSCILQTTQEVRFLDSLPSRVSGALGNLLALIETGSGVGEGILRRSVAVVGCGCDIVRVVVGRDLRGERSGASSQFLLVALSLLLVQSCDVVDMLDNRSFSFNG
jgi:hypothetical protein